MVKNAIIKNLFFLANESNNNKLVQYNSNKNY